MALAAAVEGEKRSRELELLLYVCCWARELCCTAADDMVWRATCVGGCFVGDSAAVGEDVIQYGCCTVLTPSPGGTRGAVVRDTGSQRPELRAGASYFPSLCSVALRPPADADGAQCRLLLAALSGR